MFQKFIAIIITFLSLSASAQNYNSKNYFTHDIQLTLDNDIFTLNIKSDRYYSSGIYPCVRWLADSTKKAKIIHSAQFNHKIYTPFKVIYENQKLIDRPYAGILSLSLNRDYYFLTNKYLQLQLELGWMGPASGVGQTQETWHRWFSMPTPRGWKYQINDSPVINLKAKFTTPLYDSDSFKIYSESTLAAGTIYNFYRQDIVFQIGRMLSLSKSAYNGSGLGKFKTGKSNKRTVESYLFYSPGVEYVFYNATIEGNLIGQSSIFTDQAVRWIFQHRAGVMFSWEEFDFGITAYWRTRENEKARFQTHRYVGLRFNQRF